MLRTLGGVHVLPYFLRQLRHDKTHPRSILLGGRVPQTSLVLIPFPDIRAAYECIRAFGSGRLGGNIRGSLACVGRAGLQKFMEHVRNAEEQPPPSPPRGHHQTGALPVSSAGVEEAVKLLNVYPGGGCKGCLWMAPGWLS